MQLVLFQNTPVANLFVQRPPADCAQGVDAPKLRFATGPVMMGMVLVMLLGAVFAGITAVTSDPSSSTGGPGKVWSPEHGHYH